MDNLLEQAIEIAKDRGSKYLKGTTTVDGLPEKVAELGIFLLSRVTVLKKLKGTPLREELNDIQNKLDDLRKAIFNVKGTSFKPHVE